MNPFKQYRNYRRIMGNQWLSPAKLRLTQQLKLRAMVCHAYDTVPYYRELFDQVGLKPAAIKSVADLMRIPITRKADLQALSVSQITSSKFKSGRLYKHHTSGSTGQPFSIYFDSEFTLTRNLLFLRALKTAGYRFGQKILLITDRPDGYKRRFTPGWHYASILNEPAKLYDDLIRVKPSLLYGCRTSLKLLAEYIEAVGGKTPSIQKVVTTAESLDQFTRQQLSGTFKAEVFDFYGLTEMGLIGWECHLHNGYHLSEDTAVFENLPVESLDGAFKLVMTNLHLWAMPLIRFETGDLVFPNSNKEPCACGRTLPKFDRIEGRVADIIRLEDGTIISPYRITCALEQIDDLKSYQVIQLSYDQFIVKVSVENSIGTGLEEKIQLAMGSILGSNVRIKVARADKNLALPGQKFRVVESRFLENVSGSLTR